MSIFVPAMDNLSGVGLQRFKVWTCKDICQQFIQDLGYWAFIQHNILNLQGYCWWLNLSSLEKSDYPVW
jgi:hypothetical protein